MVCPSARFSCARERSCDEKSVHQARRGHSPVLDGVGKCFCEPHWSSAVKSRLFSYLQTSRSTYDGNAHEGSCPQGLEQTATAHYNHSGSDGRNVCRKLLPAFLTTSVCGGGIPRCPEPQRSDRADASS